MGVKKVASREEASALVLQIAKKLFASLSDVPLLTSNPIPESDLLIASTTSLRGFLGTSQCEENQTLA